MKDVNDLMQAILEMDAAQRRESEKARLERSARLAALDEQKQKIIAECDAREKSESDAAKCAASGFIYTKERLKDTLPKFLWDSVPRIGYRQANALFLPGCTYCDLTARMIIFDSILNKIIYQPVDENITSDYRYSLTVPGQFYILFLGKRF